MLVQLHCENSKTKENRFVHQDDVVTDENKITLSPALLRTMKETEIEKDERWVILLPNHPFFLMQAAQSVTTAGPA